MTTTPHSNLRVGVAGLGFGASVHAPALLVLPGVDLVGIAGRTIERVNAAVADLGVANGCVSVDELLDLGVDAVFLALPPDQTEPAVRAALKRNVAVFCEKPLGTDAELAAELAQMAVGHVTAMDFIFGELEVFRRLKRLVDEKDLGNVRHAHVLWLTESWAYRSRNWSWKTDAGRGGGVISLFGTHLYFLAEWLFGPVSSLRADIGTAVASAFAPAGALAAEDLVNCRMEHRNKTIVTAAYGNANPGIAVHRWTVVFDRGSVVIENLTADYTAGFTMTVNGVAQPAFSVSDDMEKADGRLEPFTRLAGRFLEGVRNGRPVFPDLAVGARVQALDTATRQSATTGAEIALD